MMTSMLTVLSLFHLVLNVQAGVALQHRQEPESFSQSPSPTSSSPPPAQTNNLANFCDAYPNLALSDGRQIRDGACNRVPYGAIPSSSRMPSMKIISPQREATIAPNTNFTVAIALRNLASGYATDTNAEYLTTPSGIDPSTGYVRGHIHIVIEQVVSPTQTNPTDPSFFAFFKALNDPAINNKIETSVTQGLPEGQYRVCTITSNESHGPAAMPVAQRGSTEDCIYFLVGTSPATKVGNSASRSSHSFAITSLMTLFFFSQLYFLLH